MGSAAPRSVGAAAAGHAATGESGVGVERQSTRRDHILPVTQPVVAGWPGLRGIPDALRSYRRLDPVVAKGW